MRGLVALACVLLAASPEPAASADPAALLEMAIAVHGGRSALASLPHFKGTGTYEPGGRFAGRSLDVVVYERGDGGRRTEVTFEFRGRKGTSIEIYDGKMCKRKFGSTWDDLPPDENRERAAHRVSILLDALERGPKAAGEGSEAGAEVYRIEIPDGRGTATLSIAKDDARLVAIEYPATDAEGMGTKEEVVRKIVHHAFERVGGARLPTDLEVLKDGSLEGRMRFETVHEIREWDDEWLRVPDPRRRFIPPEELAN